MFSVRCSVFDVSVTADEIRNFALADFVPAAACRRRSSRCSRCVTATVSALLSIGAIVTGFVLSVIFISANGWHPAPSESIANWLTIGNLQVDFGLKLDALSLMMLLIVTGVGGAIHIYSVRLHARQTASFSRFFAFMSLFTFSMLGIVLANNFIELFIFWELVGVSSYLLIGFWFEKPSAGDAAKKAFITNRLGDFGFLLGILMVWGLLGSLNFTALQSQLTTDPGGAWGNGDHRRPADFLRCRRQIRAISAARLVAGRHGRPDARQRPHPRRDDGGRRCLHALPDFVFAQCRRAARHRLHRRIHRVARRADCRPAKRHQTHHRLLDAVATRLHGHGRRSWPARRRRCSI